MPFEFPKEILIFGGGLRNEQSPRPESQANTPTGYFAGSVCINVYAPFTFSATKLILSPSFI